MKFLFLTLTSWDEAPRARHQVAHELLSLGHEVYFVEKNSLGLPGISLEKDGNFTRIRTRFLPGYRLRFRLPVINGLYQFWLLKRLKVLLGDMFVINFDFSLHKLKHFYPDSVYYCNDEVVGNTTVKSALVDKYWKHCEITTAASARFCVATSPFLVKKLSDYNSRVYEIPLGGPDPDVIVLPPKQDSGGKIVLGLVGFIREITISSDLINDILKDENVIIRLAGTVEDKFMSNIERPSGIEQLGVLKDQALYDAIAQFDVAIIPYNQERLNPGATSNKLYLYLACGVPVVMSAMPNLKGKVFPEGCIYVSEDNSDFAQLVKKALDKEKPAFKELRKEVASKNTWKSRMTGFMQILKDLGL